jgi:tetratricopeptide (TPR) repeat protein
MSAKKTVKKSAKKKPTAKKKAPKAKPRPVKAKKKPAPKAPPKKKSPAKKAAPARKAKAAHKPRPKAKAAPEPRKPGNAYAAAKAPPPFRPKRAPLPIPPPTIVPPKPIVKEPPPAYAYDRAAAIKTLAAVIHAFEKRDWRQAFKLAAALPRLYPDFIEGVHKANYINAICRRQLHSGGQPKSAEDFELLATEHLNQGDGEGALKLLAPVIKKHTGHGGLWYLKACALVQINQPSEAIAALEKAIAIDPQNRIYALNGKDFAPLRLNPDFLALIKH